MRIAVDRRKVDRLYAPLVTLQVLVALVGVVAVALVLVLGARASAWLTAAMLVAVVLGLGLPVLVNATAWRTVRRTGTAFDLEPAGVTLNSLFGEVVAPWAAVAAVTIEAHLTGRRLRVRLVAETDPAYAGVRSTLRRGQKVVRRQGLQYALRVLDVDEAGLRRAFADRSSGRVQVD